MEKSIEELEKEQKELRDRVSKINDEIKKKKLENLNLNLEDKYIKYTDTYETTHFVHVNYVTDDKFYRSTYGVEYAYSIVGHGFYGEFTGYDDATNFYWSFLYELQISSMDIDNLIQEISKIKIITKEEFDSEFEKCVSNLIDYKDRYEK